MLKVRMKLQDKILQRIFNGELSVSSLNFMGRIQVCNLQEQFFSWTGFVTPVATSLKYRFEVGGLNSKIQ